MSLRQVLGKIINILAATLSLFTIYSIYLHKNTCFTHLSGIPMGKTARVLGSTFLGVTYLHDVACRATGANFQYSF